MEFLLIRVCLQRRDESNNFREKHVYRWRKPSGKKYSFLGAYCSERDSWLQTGVLFDFAEIPIGHPLFFLCLASSDRPRFSRFQKKKKSYAEGNDTLFQTIVTLI